MKHLFRLFSVGPVSLFAFFQVLSLGSALFFLTVQQVEAENTPTPPVVRGNQVYGLWVKLQDPHGKWSTDPRPEAILEAHRSALRVVAARYYADAPGDNPGDAPPRIPSDDTLLDMVHSFSVQKEKINAAQYRGMFHVTFKRSALQKWLKHATLEPGEDSSQTTDASDSPASGEGAFDDAGEPLVLNVKIASLGDWIQIKKIVDTFAAQLAQQQILSLSPSQGRLALSWRGSTDLFASRLETLGFKVTKQLHQWDIEKTVSPVSGAEASLKETVS